MKKKSTIIVSIVTIIILTLSYFSSNPIISYKTDVSDNYSNAIENQSRGVYSHQLPLVPVWVSVNGISENTVYYTIYYFPFGSVDMSFTEDDGYNIEKPLINH